MGKTFEYELLSQEEAKEQSLRAMEKRPDLTNAIKSIKEAIAKGEFDCDVDLRENGSVSYLKERGYGISSTYGKGMFKVSWN